MYYLHIHIRWSILIIPLLTKLEAEQAIYVKGGVLRLLMTIITLGIVHV